MDRAWKAKLCDFGLAATAQAAAGTPAYMAPELLAGRAYTDKVDVYSFGIVLNEMHTRSPPFAGVDEGRLSDLVAQGRRPELATGLAQQMTDLIRHCWDASPARRPTFEEIIATFLDMRPER